MPIEAMIAAIEARAYGRFTVTAGDDDLMPTSSGLPQLAGGRVCRLQRSGAAGGGRTILVAEVAFTSEAIQTLYSWAADVREQLPEPETADLYMFLLIQGIPDEEAARIETDDRFCRKVVLRDSESVADLLDRTFLAMVSKDAGAGAIGDPLQAALTALADEHPWTQAHLGVWREMLLSGKTGADLARALGSAASSGETVP
jgi:hypothetical protein